MTKQKKNSSEVNRHLALKRLGEERPLTWAVNNTKTPKGDALDFENHPFLYDIYKDRSKDIAIQKSAQMGLSTWAINRALWFADTCNISVIYTFPTVGDATDFSKTRVRPIIQASPYLLNKVTAVESEAYGQMKIQSGLQIMRLGGSFIYFRGTWTETEAISIDADMLIHDETDRSKPEIISVYKERLSHSKYGDILHLSNPSLPQFGINAFYLRSDMKKWFIVCPLCSKEQVLIYPDSIGGEEEHEFYRCIYCHSKITDDVRKQGYWKPTNEGAKISGYHVTQLMAPWISAADIAQKKRDELWLQTFHNFVLGEPYAGENVPIKRSDMLACEQRRYELGKVEHQTYMGVDQGDKIHAVIFKKRGDTMRLVHAEILDSFDRLPDLMDYYHVVSCVIDAMPNKHSARQFAQRYPSRIWLCYYSETQKELVKWTATEEIKEWRVTAQRTETIDRWADLVKKHNLILPKITEVVDEFIRQNCGLAKEMVEKPDGTIVWRYKPISADHFAHAANYGMIAASRATAGSLAEVSKPIPKGSKPITSGLLDRRF